MLADTPLPRGFGAALASVDTFFPRAPEQFVTSPLCLVGYVRWDARSDRVPPLQTIIFSSFPGRTSGRRPFTLLAARNEGSVEGWRALFANDNSACNLTVEPQRSRVPCRLSPSLPVSSCEFPARIPLPHSHLRR